MEDINYPYYGMEYGAPIHGGTKSASSTDPPSEASGQENVLPLIHMTLFDPRRLDECDLKTFEYFDPRKTTPSSKESFSGTTPPAYYHDPRRASIHPMGIAEKPPGVSETLWYLLDADGLIPKHQAAESAKDKTKQPLIPEQTALKKTQKVLTRLSRRKAKDDVTEDKKDPTEMPFLDHLEEFRWALLKSITAIMVCMVVAWYLSDAFYSSITRLAREAELPLIITKVMEPLMLKLQMAFIMGLILALPLVFYFLWGFVSPGLYSHEKRWILPLIVGATFCFVIGAGIAYLVMIPFMLKFIKNFIPPDVKPMITIGDFIGKILQFSLLFGIIFELPFVSLILAKIGILKHKWMSKYRNYAVVIIFIFAAVFTPPDPLSQIMMAIPLLILYEISIIVARVAGRKTLL